MNLAPYIEVEVLHNADDIDEFLITFGYDEEDIEIVLVEDDSFGGWYADFVLIEDGEVLACTDTWDSKRELTDYLLTILGKSYQMRDEE